MIRRAHLKRIALPVLIVSALVGGGCWFWESWLQWHLAWTFSPGGSLRDGGLSFASEFRVEDDFTLQLEKERKSRPEGAHVQVWNQYELPSVPGFDRRLISFLIQYGANGEALAAVSAAHDQHASERTVDWGAIRDGKDQGLFLDFRRGYVSRIRHWQAFIELVIAPPAGQGWNDYYRFHEEGLQVSWDFDDNGAVIASWLRAWQTPSQALRVNGKGAGTTEGVHHFDASGNVVLPDGPYTLEQLLAGWPALPPSNPPTPEVLSLYRQIEELSRTNMVARRWLEARRIPEKRWPPRTRR